MVYYPLSQIQQNLYTNGGEYILSTTKENYKGFYYQISNGKKYTGKTPQDGPNILLSIINFSTINEDNGDDINNIISLTIPAMAFDNPQSNNPKIPLSYLNNEISTEYNKLNLLYTPSERFIPLFNPTLPTEKDLNLGQFNRYFCKKTNELKYLEIDKKTYDQLKAKDPKIAWDLYEPASILWITSRYQEDTFNTNKLSVFKIEQNQRWYGFSQYFKEDYLKYYSFEDDSL